MKYLLLVLAIIPTKALADNVNFTNDGRSVTISIGAEVTSFQVITDDGKCSINGNAIDCAEIGGFIEPANTDLTTIEKKDSPHGNFQ